MATVTVRVPAAPGGSRQVKKVLIKLGSEVLTVPLTSPRVEHGDLSANWVQIGRPQLQPLQRKGPGRLRTMKFETMFVADGRPVEGGLQILRRFGNAEQPLTVVYGPLENGLWRLADITMISERRQEGTDAILRADVRLMFVEYADDGYTKPASTQAAPRPPVTKAAAGAPAKTTKPATATATRTHTVVRGDTLSAIAARYYGDANRFGEIAKANQIRNPNLIKPGQKLRIP